MYLNSDSGELLGQGQTYYYRETDGYFWANESELSYLNVFFATFDYSHSWNLSFGAPEGATLGMGTFLGAMRFASSVNPSLDISGDRLGCNEATGGFEMKELLVSSDLVSSFNSVFEQHCDQEIPALHGEVWYHSMNAITSYPFAAADRDQAVSYQIVANNQPISYGASALPGGLSVNTSTGLITGTPTIGGTHSVLMTATGPSLAAAGRLTLVISPPAGDSAPVITSASTVSDTINQSFSYQILATNSPTQFAATGLPPGVSVDAVTGLISGTPAAVGTFPTITTATNATGTGGSSLTVSIYPPIPAITGVNHATALQARPFSFQATASNQPTNYSASGLPTGLTIGSTNGLISGVAFTTGTFILTVRAWNGSGVGFQMFTLTVNQTPPVITSPTAADGVQGQFFTYQITADGSPDRFAASGLPAGLSVDPPNGFISGTPSVAGSFNVTISATNSAGTGSANLLLTIAAKPNQLLNLSTRLQVGIDDNVLIGGFIVTGFNTKNVVIRGLGPSLGALGVQGALADPILELHDTSGNTLATNDNWKENQAAVEATGVPPSNDLESAIVTTLPANGTGYTAVLRGKDNSTEVGLVEVYDLDPLAASVLAKISTRGVVGTADNVLIDGFIAGGGSGDGRIIARAIGPSLATSGVTDALQDPVLELHNGDGDTIASNDNWKETQQDQIEETGIAPNDDRESAIVATLPGGPHTAVVRGSNDGVGVGLVEISRLP